MGLLASHLLKKILHPARYLPVNSNSDPALPLTQRLWDFQMRGGRFRIRKQGQGSSTRAGLGALPPLQLPDGEVTSGGSCTLPEQGCLGHASWRTFLWGLQPYPMAAPKPQPSLSSSLALSRENFCCV